jgi:hypothetical protein
MKIVLNIGFVIMGVIALFGFPLSFPAYHEVSRFDKPMPINEMHGVVVDSNGNYYYGSRQFNNIQVFSNQGKFEYGFSFPNDSGLFEFYIDDEDRIHVATSVKFFSFYGGNLIGEKEYDETFTKAVIQDICEDLRKNEYQVHSDEIYVIKGKRIEILDPVTRDVISRIKPKTPVWPLSMSFYWFIGMIAAMGLFAVNRGFLDSVRKANKHK